MNTSINQDANAVANLQRCEIPSKNLEDIPSIKTRVFKIKLDQLIKDTCGRVSRLGPQLAGIVRFG